MTSAHANALTAAGHPAARTVSMVSSLLFLVMVWQPTHAKQVCATQSLGNRDFQGVSGSDDNNVIAVGKNGQISRFDGAAWSFMASPTGEELNDVHVIDGAQSIAVGKNGTVLLQNGALWSDVGPATNEELLGVWAASASEIWVAGKKGEIHYYDGVSWADVSAPAGTSNRDIEDLWGDANSVYALDDRGNLYRYDRSTLTWDGPDALCATANGFEDLWGDDLGNLYLVAREDIFRHDGASCNVIETASERLLGVSGSLATGEAYAVGKKGAVVYYNGAAFQETQVGTEELRDDWVSPIGNAYYAGKKGELTVCLKVIPQVVADYRFDDCTLDLPGSTVLDSGPNGLDGTTAAGGVSLEPDGQLCPAVNFDGGAGYVGVPDAAPLDVTEGVSFAIWIRRGTSPMQDWDALFAKGNSAYRLHLNGGCTIADTLPGNTRLGLTFGLNGGCGGADLNSNVVPVPGVWYHVAGTYDRTDMHIYINGSLVNSARLSAAVATNNFDLFIGENSQQRSRYWDGDIDELTLWDEAITARQVTDHMNRTRPCTACSEPEFVVTHDNSGIHCLDETVRVDVIDSLAGTPLLTYDQEVTLDTGSGTGTWTLVSGGGVFFDVTSDDGLATYVWPLGESLAEFALTYREGNPAINVDVFETLQPLIRDQDSEGNLVFSASGFTVTSAPLSNPPPALIPPFLGPRVAATDMALFLSAYGTTPNQPQCGVIESYTGVRNLSFWSDYQDPATGSIAVGIDGVAAAANEPAATPQAVLFANGQAQVTARYKDAGRIQILMKDDGTPHPDLPGGIRGATGGFVVTPARFTLSNIENAAGNPNPGAAGPADPVFANAGVPFSVTVTALDAEGDPTPNFGQEGTPESVTLTPTLVAPAGGVTPPVTAAAGFGPFAGGWATGTDFVWPEVGIITLTPSVDDGSYLTAGDVSGSTSGNVGRFIPDHFSIAENVPAFATACASGGFTYVGETFDYLTPPVLTVTARALGGSTTRNYAGAFFRLDNTTLSNRTYSAVSGSLDLSGLPGTAVDPLVTDSGNGVGTLAFSSGSGLVFDRLSPVSPFDADIQLSIDVFDADSVAPVANPVTVGGAGGMAFDAGAEMRWGRAVMSNASGSELVNLALTLRTEYYVDAATGFVPHLADACSAPVPLTLAGYSGNLSVGETCVQDSGSPGSSGAGCPAPGPAAEQYRAPPLGGDFNLFLAAPGAGNDGAVTLSGDAPAWLEFDWDAGLPGLEDPAGTAVFGIFSGNTRRIYTREVY